MGLGPPELLIVLVLVVLLFGASKLPKLARSVGEAQREFERGQRGELATGSEEPKHSS